MSKITTGKLEGAVPFCPKCGAILNGYTTNQAHAVPRAGDVSVCAACYAVLMYEENMSLSLAPAEVVEAVSPQIKALVSDLYKEKESPNV